MLVRSYRTVSPLPVRARRPAIGGFLSVALSCGSPRLAVSQHPALWSPDLPRPAPAPKGDSGRGHPAGSPSAPVWQATRNVVTSLDETGVGARPHRRGHSLSVG